MQAPKFAKLLAQLALLNQPQRQQVLAAVHPAAGLDRVVALVDGIRSDGRHCPNCGCERCHRHGRADGARVTSVEQLLRIAFGVINS